MFSLRGHERALIGWIEFELVEPLEASLILVVLGLLGGREKYKDTDTVTYTGRFNLWFAECICCYCSFILPLYCYIWICWDLIFLVFHYYYYYSQFSIDVTLTLF